MYLYRAGQIIFKEGDVLDRPLLVLSGEMVLTSTLGYRIKAKKGEVVGEWVLIDDPVLPESGTAVTKVELAPVDEIKFSMYLLDRAFMRIEETNKSFTRELLSQDETLKIIRQYSRGRWKFLFELEKNPLYKARELIAQENFEKAYDYLMNFDKRSADPYLSNEVEIWKAYCLYFIDPKSASVRYGAIVRKADEYKRHISFSILMTLFSKGPEGLNTTLKMFLKHGIFIPPRTIVMVEGEMGYESYFILSGYPRVVRFSAKEERILSFVGPAEIVGEVSTIGERPRTATVITNSPVQALRFNKKTLEEIVKQNEDFAMQLLKSVLKRVKKMRILKEAGKSPSKRFEFLLKTWDVKDLNAMEINLEEMEKFLGLDRRETIDFLNSTKIVSLKSDGTIRFFQKR